MVDSASSCLGISCLSARARRFFSAGALALILALAGCGDDDEKPAAATAPTGTETSATVRTTATEPAGKTTPDVPSATVTSPEDKPGGAGDEVPAQSQALITGKGGKLSPLRVQVPPFIAVKLVLVSADGERYQLANATTTIAAGRGIKSASATLDGLKTGERVVLKGPQGDVLIEASAEPGP